MQTNIIRSERLDGIDRSRFAAMIESESFQLLRRRITAELERARKVCERSESGLDIRRAQGAAAAFQTVLELPERLLLEMSKTKHEP